MSEEEIESNKDKAAPILPTSEEHMALLEIRSARTSQTNKEKQVEKR